MEVKFNIRLYSDNSVKIIKEESLDPEGIFYVPDAGTYKFLKHDYQREEFDFKPRNGHERPETVQFDVVGNIDFSPMSREFQEFWFELIWEANKYTRTRDETLLIWEDVTAHSKMLTDLHSREQGFTDYILGVNLGSSKGPMQIKTLSCGGNIVHVTSGSYVRTVDNNKVPTSIKEFMKDNAVCHWATATGLRNSNGDSNKIPGDGYKVVKFPNQKPYGIPFPFTSSAKTKFRRENVLNIDNGTIYSPYNPMPKQ